MNGEDESDVVRAINDIIATVTLANENIGHLVRVVEALHTRVTALENRLGALAQPPRKLITTPNGEGVIKWQT